MIVIPEEAELLISVLRECNQCCTYLLTYTVSVTRKMLHFNDLIYYAIPPLPDGWKALTWLIIKLGILSGRLYFEFEEYAALRKYLGFSDAEASPAFVINVDEIRLAK